MTSLHDASSLDGSEQQQLKTVDILQARVVKNGDPWKDMEESKHRQPRPLHHLPTNPSQPQYKIKTKQHCNSASMESIPRSDPCLKSPRYLNQSRTNHGVNKLSLPNNLSKPYPVSISHCAIRNSRLATNGTCRVSQYVGRHDNNKANHSKASQQPSFFQRPSNHQVAKMEQNVSGLCHMKFLGNTNSQRMVFSLAHVKPGISNISNSL
eukprot:sb/3470314/